MMRKVYRKVDLDCVMQETEMKRRDCRKGLLSHDEEGLFRFEEIAPEPRRLPRPKLFDGRLVSLVRFADGRYRVYFKAKNCDVDLHDVSFAFRVYQELNEALRFVKTDDSGESPSQSSAASKAEGSGESPSQSSAASKVEGSGESTSQSSAASKAEGSGESPTSGQQDSSTSETVDQNNHSKEDSNEK